MALVNEPFYREGSAAARDYRSPRESWNSTRTSMPLVVVELQRGEKVGRKKNGEEKGSKTLRKGNERESIIYYDVEGL